MASVKRESITSQTARIGKSYSSPIHRKITVGPNRISTQDINSWVQAVNIARDPNFPRRRLLYQLYHSIALDGHLQSVMEKRRIAITNQKILWNFDDNKKATKEQHKLDQEKLNKINDLIIRTPWFNDLISHAMDADPWGHSLIELIVDGAAVVRADLIPRENVIPELGILFWNYFNIPIKSDNAAFRDDKPIDPQTGIYYRTDPESSPYLIEVGKPKSYGKLMTAAQYVIYKRGGFGNWGQFAELFGMPFRVGKYNPFDPDTRKKLEDGLDAMGSAAWAVIPDGASIDFHVANAGGNAHTVFQQIIQTCNEEISKLFLGNTLTTSQGTKGARSLGQVHKAVEEDINVSDMIRIEYLLNWHLKDKLIEIYGGDLLTGGRFSFPETTTIPLQERITIDMNLAKVIDIPAEYFYETYGIAHPEDGDIPARIPSNTPADPNGDPNAESNDDEKKKLSRKTKSAGGGSGKALHLRLHSLYHHTLTHHVKLSASNNPSNDPAFQSIWDRITQAIHDGTLKKGDVDPALVKWTATQLIKGVTESYGSTGDFSAGSKDANMLTALTKNVQVFSGFKTYQQLRDATDLLKDKNGDLKGYAQFREDILAISQKYNQVYLQAEYQQSVAASQMASNWVDIEANADALPMLTYITAGDDHVRPEHAILEGATYPVDDPFWDTYYPPLDWGCRCDVLQNDDAASPVAKGDLPPVKDMFAVNWGKEQIVFPDTHPYFDVSQAEYNDIMDQLDQMEEQP